MEYSFKYTSKFTSNGHDSYLLHILRDGEVVQSQFANFPEGTLEDVLNLFAENLIQDFING